MNYVCRKKITRSKAPTVQSDLNWLAEGELEGGLRAKGTYTFLFLSQLAKAFHEGRHYGIATLSRRHTFSLKASRLSDYLFSGVTIPEVCSTVANDNDDDGVADDAV